MSMEKTALIPMQALRNVKGIGRILEHVGPGARKVLIGPKKPPAVTNRIVGEWGGLDYDLLRGQQLKKQFQRAGVEGPLPFEKGQGQIDFDKMREVESALPPFWKGFKGHDPEAIATGLRGAGVDLTPEQAQGIIKAYSPGRSTGRFIKNLFLGEAPLKTTYQRYLQGGLAGKGGVLLGEAAPGGHLGRAYSRAYDAARAGQYGRALKEIPYGGTLGYGLNAGFGYAFPAYLGYEAYRSAEQQGQNPLAALGASGTTALGGVLMAPLGLAQMQLFGPMERASQKLWGLKPPGAMPSPPPQPVHPPRPAPQRAARLYGRSSRPTGYQSALHNTMPPGSY
jgi:hypothetical protein